MRLEAFDNDNNQPTMGATKAGGGWQESVDEAITEPQRWATMNNESIRRMMIAATKRMRVARVMVDGNEGGGQQRGPGRQRGQWS